ncbi:SGNH/GDSL hydrolase family protein [Thermomonospora umbrina]|uniref:Lysophospholipase L1-like esterase n=1 Tax=Thermomonospora umbrina TaxID=111806 RepID=A0A3D9ST93_9ACTN|nr:SGNH/GDSL hydrolase family protein [Thermomonospora umbrina]REE99018.1 lysophospholipase L1-like esterase [Thermomonospora umbrina]
MRYVALRAVQPFALLLAPILAVQGRGVRATTPRLPEAAGPDEGAVDGRGPVLRLTVLGDSTAMGVGAERHAEALPGFLAAVIAERTGRPVAWRVAGRTGTTARRLREDHVPGLAAADLVVIMVGVNDLLRLRPLRAWERDVRDLVTAVREVLGPVPVPVLVTGMPPLHRFPSLPQPLRAVMGLRAHAMDHAARRAAARLPRVAHVRAAGGDPGDERFFGADRFHPSVEGYRLWAGQLAGPAAELAG